LQQSSTNGNVVKPPESKALNIQKFTKLSKDPTLIHESENTKDKYKLKQDGGSIFDSSSLCSERSVLIIEYTLEGQRENNEKQKEHIKLAICRQKINDTDEDKKKVLFNLKNQIVKHCFIEAYFNYDLEAYKSVSPKDSSQVKIKNKISFTKSMKDLNFNFDEPL